MPRSKSGRFWYAVRTLVILAGGLSLLFPSGWAQKKESTRKPAAEKPDKSAESTPNEDLTAEELLFESRKAKTGGDFKRAAALLSQFLREYGTSPAVAPKLASFRYEYAMNLLQARELAEALPAIEETLATTPPPDAGQKQMLLFWKALCLLNDDQFADARTALDEFLALFPPRPVFTPVFVQQNPGAVRIPEAKLLRGQTLLLEGKIAEGVEYLESVKPDLPAEMRGRATVLQLYGLVQDSGTEDSRKKALEIVVREYPNIGDLTQIIAFQVLTLQLGAEFLEEGEPRRAIQCLQRVWDSDRLLKHQEKRVEALQARARALEANPHADPYEKLQAAQMIAKVEREKETFAQINEFDAALRMRLASAYQQMSRFRESALVLEDILDRMEPGPVVENASISLVQNWNQLERWDRAVSAADKFSEKFPASKQLPLVLYLKGIAQQKASRHDDALATFERIQKDFPESDFAPRALFQEGFTQLLAEDQTAAVKAFESLPKKHKGSELVEAALYWRGMGYSLAKNHEKARSVFAEYLKNYPSGSHRGAAEFRKAYCAQNAMAYPTAIRELRAFLKNHPGHESTPEALVLLGDALMAEGNIGDGIEAFAKIPPEQTRFYEEGVFKTAKAYREMEEPAKLIAHLGEFVEKHPASQRTAEALFLIADTHRRAGDDEKARAIYWEAIAKHGNNPTMRSIEEAFPALARFYRGPEAQKEYLEKLRDFPSDSPVLKMRLLWAQALALRKSDPDASKRLFLEAAEFANPQTTNPLLLSDFADALDAMGNAAAAEQMRRDLVKWNPRSPFKDRALAEIGFAEIRKNRTAQALKTFDRFVREHPGSPRTGSVLLAKAGLLSKKDKPKEALAALEMLLAEPDVSKQEKAEALFRMGEIHLANGRPKLAVPYFTRVFVMYGRWAEWVARSYLASGQAFEQLKDREAARRTYAEFLSREELAQLPEFEEARKRLEKLGGPPESKPAPAKPGETAS